MKQIQLFIDMHADILAINWRNFNDVVSSIVVNDFTRQEILVIRILRCETRFFFTL